ncbi:protein-S-isoprenylcysteine O-methyltransferase Ste14 [Rhodopirellula rubra]|uniref:Protein-S-isoprenylcysteine O-methyltransferase Ste14 n=1 Tax=Aporhodopirellula rubra TaxID=980271 RepID=A0A7W5H336_9BACT|nr:isoprenylcysteine carboxylmethyltransferase family protein [Aporhodopirellula rubra]MBB3204847.1 protein-S-isoprenylcysteine O-methyltransferase Ste14 [Aporhodopirellula rubra]
MQSKLIQQILVVLQFTTAAALVLTANDVLNSPTAITSIIAGALLGVWAWVSFGLKKITVMPELKSDAELVTAGPYRFIRHPMYTAVVLFCFGFLLTSPSMWKVATWILLIAVVSAKARIEESFLCKRFPQYPDYIKRTGRFIPFW